MKTKITGIVVILLFSGATFGQTKDFIKSDGITSPLHQSNIGKITFMSAVIPIEQYTAADFLKTFEWKVPSDLNIRAFLGNSLTNYLHPLAPALTVEELTKKGNYQFSFFVDSILVYKENLSPGAGSPQNKNTKTILRVPFTSTTNEDSWGRFLWMRFMINGGEEALTRGTHLLRIEARPYVRTTEIKVGEVIAAGDLQMIVVKPAVDEKAVQIQSIASGSGWNVSTDDYNTTKIKELNFKIADKIFKDITSIVVIKDGKLLIEEYFNDAKRDALHDTRSVGKSFTSAMMGIAINNGYIKNEQQTLGTYYHLKQFENYTSKKDSVTLKSLLTMSSAFDGYDMDDNSPGNEEKMYPTSNWVKFTLDLPMDSTSIIGNNWMYFTAGVVVLGDVLNKAVPEGLEKYTHKMLMQPLGIKTYQWMYTPQKVVSTAGGLQMRSLDYAKFGQLYKNNGIWEGQQIIPADWVKKTFTKYLPIAGSEDEFYGYLFWNKTYKVNGKLQETFYSSGNGGNKIFVFKELPLVVVITSTAYNTPYGHSQVDKIMERYILPAVVK
ncbi:CubicO group peptidase (beta-lactamase class C family) [Chitinophaga niastensis]|uniref:CubicO group peptidase (Beta-lactamase class C family) n=1 Tax=Chitinophaga niastensis TaxID=536980 RepID=A0A2P8HJM0_CHINA|nr:serine hydrolase [Chitinophaga niastensis]PSL46370.1 CubicO group peptidase (beta-lactamase class C family) [Chitinophaga niastensis]